MKQFLYLFFSGILIFSLLKTKSSHECFYFDSSHECKDTSLAIDKCLKTYYLSFVEDAKKHNLNIDHVYCLDKINTRESTELQGVTMFENNCIVVNKILVKEDTLGTKFVFYHELGHWFGLKHSNGIMQPSYNAYQDLSWVKENWGYLVCEHFKRLNNLQN